MDKTHYKALKKISRGRASDVSESTIRYLVQNGWLGVDWESKYFVNESGRAAMHQFRHDEKAVSFWRGVAIGFIAGMLTDIAGQALGVLPNWLQLLR